MIWTLAVTLLSPVVIGYLLVRALSPRRQPAWAGFVFTASLGAGLGVGVLSFLYFLVWLLIRPSNAVYWGGELVLLGIAASACWSARGQSPGNVPPAPATRGWSWLLLAILVAALGMAALMFADSSLSDPHGNWDAWAIWNLRAKILTQHDAHWKDAFSPLLNQLAGFGATHGDYPLLLSGYIGRCWGLIGSVDDVTPPIAVAGLFSFATVGLMVGGLALLRGWSTSMMGGLVLLGTAGFLLDSPWQFADVPLGFFYLSVFVLFFLIDADPERRTMAVLAGLALGCAAWTKDEGLLFAALAGVSLAAYLLLSKGGGRAKTFALFAAGFMAPLLIVLYFKFVLAPKGASWRPLTLTVAMHHLVQPARYARITKTLWEEGVALGTGIANPAVYVAVFAACLGVPRSRLRKPIVLAAFALWLAIFASYLLIYLVTPFDLSWQLGTSLGRLLVQLVPSFIFLVMAVCRTAEETAIVPDVPLKAARVSRKKVKRMQASKA